MKAWYPFFIFSSFGRNSITRQMGLKVIWLPMTDTFQLIKSWLAMTISPCFVEKGDYNAKMSRNLPKLILIGELQTSGWTCAIKNLPNKKLPPQINKKKTQLYIFDMIRLFCA